ncbi:helix-turn-helix domain-containing protein [Actinokineospora spheciospongiae]|uniref:helix-turn-helix domain-containing protein n=1 Tax=Actinokineospora spheciospongiae TaxID=909613 RepID=UPI000D709B7E|nr:helix-turn-helix transcriptional regulator [Actinokineospora spheciospongiae]PWW62531.1 transcriptional regulator with XRE-family HTH domain [Actinokineospora spheciospongiae]
MTVLLREAIGDRLRHARTNQQRTLREVSRSARVSLGYLSEVERGRKEASSELLAAICDALELPLSELLHHVASDISALTSVEDGVPQRVGAEPVEAVDAAKGPAGPRASAEGGRLVPAVVGENLADLRLQPVLSHRLDTTLGGARAGAVFAA